MNDIINNIESILLLSVFVSLLIVMCIDIFRDEDES